MTAPPTSTGDLSSDGARCGLRLLVVEDNPINQLVLSTMLTRLGHTAVVLDNGRAALERVAREDFDAVLMDVQMPQMDGLEATVGIRRAEANTGRRVPIIALTAHAMTGDRERCLAAGMDHYLSKPIEFEALVAVLACLTAPSAPGRAGLVSVGESAYCRSLALEQTGGDAALLQELIGIFLDNEPRWREDLRGAAATGDLALLHRTAHLLRGATATFGADQATSAAERLEQAADTGDGPATAQNLTTLEQTLNRLTAALRADAAAFSENRP